MSHHHTRPLNKERPSGGPLPHDVYGAIVGTIDGPLGDQDDNHVYIPLRIHTGPLAGLYRLAFNTESTDRSSDQFAIYDEPIEMADVPSEGFTQDASLSYAGIGLHQADFSPITNGKLRTLTHDSAQDADLMGAYGFTFSDGGGLHDIHFNNGEPPGSKFKNQPNKDGALVFYTLNRSGQTTRRWIFIKFQEQNLP
jgi:hypothetical protein